MPRLMQTSSFKAIQTISDGLQPAVASNQQLQGNATKTHFLQRVAKGRTHQRRHAKSFALQVFSFHVSDYLFAREPPQATNHASCFKRLPEKGRLYITVGNTLHVRRYRTHDPCSVQCEFSLGTRACLFMLCSTLWIDNLCRAELLIWCLSEIFFSSTLRTLQRQGVNEQAPRMQALAACACALARLA